MPVAYTNDVPFFDLKALLVHPCIALQCPDRPDPDSLAAAFGLYAFFRSQGIKTDCFYCGPAPFERPNLLEMQRVFSLPVRHEPAPGPCAGLLITVGCQYGAATLTAVQAEAVAVVDCRVPESNGAVLGEIRPYLSSCSSIVYQLLRAAAFSVDRALGTALRFGLYTASNAFSELRFPLDRDMRDELPHDARLFANLTRSNLCPEDLSLTARALNGLDFSAHDGMLLSNVLSCEPDLLRFIADLALHVHGVELSAVFTERAEGVRFSIRSAHREMHAGKSSAHLVAGGLGTGGGGAEKGGGFISASRYDALCRATPLADFFRERLRAYRDEYTLFDCLAEKSPQPGTLYAYQKLPVTQAYVVCSALFPKKTRLLVRMLEGDIVLTVSSDSYLMIGLAGEVYPIDRQTFAALYQATDTAPELAPAYAPAVIDIGEASRVELLPHARGCISRERRILARQLERGVKIFTRWDEDNYVQGEPGDWLAKRRDDSRDLYVIKKHIFPLLYERVTDRKTTARSGALPEDA